MVAYVPLEEMTDSQWAASYTAFYSPELTEEMGGVVPDTIIPLQDFYNKTMEQVERGLLKGWAIVDDEAYLGHVLLVRPHGEWEVGVALVGTETRGRGLGIRATLYALRVAFEELGAEQVVAFAHGSSGEAKGYLLRGGFRPFLNFLYMPKEVWLTRWAGRN